MPCAIPASIGGTYYSKVSAGSPSFASCQQDSRKVDLSTVTAARQQEQIQKEEQFIRTFRDSWVDASFQLTANQNVKFPARADDGRADCVLCTTLLNNAKNGNDLKYAWQNELKQLWIRPSPGGSSKPPRYTAVSLVYPLVICIEEAGRKRFNDAVKVFETCIKMINEDGMTYKCKLQLGLRKDKQVGFPEDLKGYYRPVSSSSSILDKSLICVSD